MAVKNVALFLLTGKAILTESEFQRELLSISDQALISALQNKDWRVCNNAVSALKDRMAKWDDQALISALQNKNWRFCNNAVSALKERGKTKFLKDEMLE